MVFMLQSMYAVAKPTEEVNSFFTFFFAEGQAARNK